ncbi:Double-strand recombination repair protein [Nakaseomyces glabratus]|nr:Double-strand recombination repair protein [Nakaseomyces glabratus]KAH7597845.1 Double-strand recombination repair protein [Nakaseomyces glabratus]KAH7612139.1 Double-strand recombination repair protein [Nakaseomyces glabratus]
MEDIFIGDDTTLLESASQPGEKPSVKTVNNGKVLKPRNENIKRHRLILSEYRRKIRDEEKDIRELKQAIKIIEEKKLEHLMSLIEKWREVSQKTLSYMQYSTVLKIDKMGGFKKYMERELENKLLEIEDEYTRFEEEMGSFLESDEFERLSEEQQEEYKDQINSRRYDLEKLKLQKTKEIEKEYENVDDVFTLQELTKLLKIDYKLIFPH